jgi:uncharacterized protein with PQ loop repeat
MVKMILLIAGTCLLIADVVHISRVYGEERAARIKESVFWFCAFTLALAWMLQ